MDLKNYVIDKFEKYFFENKKAINIREACYLYMDKNNLLAILDEEEFFAIDGEHYGLIKWVLEDLNKIFSGTGCFELINVKEIAEKTYGVKVTNIKELLSKLNIDSEYWKFDKVSFKKLLNQYNISCSLNLISKDKKEKSLINELEEEIIAEKRIIKKLECKLREQELFKINIELDNIMKYYAMVETLPLSSKIAKFLSVSENGMTIDEIYHNIILLENVTKEALIEELKESKLFLRDENGRWVLRNREFNKRDIDMKELIDTIECYVKASTSKLLKQSWSIFKEYNFTKEEVSLQKIGEKYGYTRDYTFQLHNMSIEIFEHKKIKRYLSLYIKNIEKAIKEEKFIKIKSDSYKRLVGQWNTKKFINFINKLGIDLILTDNKYILNRPLYEDYLVNKKDKSFRNSKKKFTKKNMVVNLQCS
ncbi:MAG: hypothetical protein ACRDD2_07415 [Sarcina sp.]